MLEIINLGKAYKLGKKIEDVRALNDINLNFADKGLVAIVGTSGCGKTTLLNILGGIDVPTEGKVVCDGKEVQYSDNKMLELYRSQDVSIVFQDYNLLHEYTVLENIKLGMQIQGEDKEVAEERAKDALEAVGLSQMSDRKITALSGGQQQRIAIARAIAKKGKFILCDEPTGNLDSNNSKEIFALLKELSTERLIIVVTHDGKLAEKFADRIVRLEDGHVVSDITLSDSSKAQSSQTTSTQKITYDDEDTDVPAKSKKSAKRRGGLSVKNVFVMIKDNIMKSLLSNITMFIALLATFTLVTSFFSLNRFSTESAYLNTLRANNQYVIAITKYVDAYYEMPAEGDEGTGDGTETVPVYGPSLDYENADPKDIKGENNNGINLLQLVDNKASFYSSYFFNKNLQDFTTKKIIQEDKKYSYYAYGFRDIVAVDDFSTFNMKLVAGNKPSQTNEVLIYDYMAKSMIELDFFDSSVKDVKDVVGKTLTDVDTGLSMKVVGIVGSSYEQYEYVKNGTGLYSFEEAYLSSLQTIFCQSEFIEQVQNDMLYMSFFKSYAYKGNSDGTGTDTKFDLSYKKMYYIDTQYRDGLTYIATIEDVPTKPDEDGNSGEKQDFDTSRGIIMSKSQVAKILGKDKNEVTRDDIITFMSEYKIEMTYNVYDYSYQRSYSYLDGYQVIGVCEEDVETSNIKGENTDGTLIIYTPNQIGSESGDDFSIATGQFRQIFLSLGTNWNDNAEVLSKLIVSNDKGLDFYLANPDFKEEGYTLFSPYSVLIQDSTEYMGNVKTFSGYIMYLLLALTVVLILIYTYISLKRYNYKIGVLKALGANSWNILLIFGLQLLLVSLLAFVVSIPVAFAVMSRINYSFVADINPTMVFFAVDGFSISMALIIATVGVALVALFPLIKLCLASPMSVIRGSKADE